MRPPGTASWPCPGRGMGGAHASLPALPPALPLALPPALPPAMPPTLPSPLSPALPPALQTRAQAGCPGAERGSAEADAPAPEKSRRPKKAPNPFKTAVWMGPFPGRSWGGGPYQGGGGREGGRGAEGPASRAEARNRMRGAGGASVAAGLGSLPSARGGARTTLVANSTTRGVAGVARVAQKTQVAKLRSLP